MTRQTRGKGRRGSVLLEYVVLLVFVILPLLGVQQLLMDPTAGPDPSAVLSGLEGQVADRPDYGVLGNAFVGWYQRLVTGTALPIP